MIDSKDIKAIETFLLWLANYNQRNAIEGMELAVYISYMTNSNKTVKDVYENFNGKWPFSGEYMYFSHITEDFEFEEFSEEFAYKVCSKKEFEEYNLERHKATAEANAKYWLDSFNELRVQFDKLQEEKEALQKALYEAVGTTATLLDKFVGNPPERATKIKRSKVTQGLHWFNDEGLVWAGTEWAYITVDDPKEWETVYDINQD